MPPPPPDAYPPPAAPWQQAPGAGSPGFPWKPVALGVGIAVGVLGLVLVVVNLLGGGSRNIDVNFTVYGVEGCDLGLGYMDVPGSTVIIKADGELAGSGSLTQFGSDEGFSCEFTSVVLDVPDDASLYSVEVGSRGVVTSTRAELEGNGWAFDLSLGL